ncbi:MAG: phosphoribosylamine--glycine ligase [Isosphaeraceae bacterium]
MALKVLVVGRGGREHAICWKLAQSARVGQIICAPGNAGTAMEPKVTNAAVEPNDVRGLLNLARRQRVDLTVVGPEEPLTLGIADAFAREGLRVLGPKAAAAELEGSKIFCKEMMRQASIPTADCRIFRSAPDAEKFVMSRDVQVTIRSKGRSTVRQPFDCVTAADAIYAIEKIFDPRNMLSGNVQVEIEEGGEKTLYPTAAEARKAIMNHPIGMVVKADGLAAGKGVYVCSTIGEAMHAVDQMMIQRIFGKAGDSVVIEERLDGVETSVLALTDGRSILPLPSSQDHKRALDGDKGPNTGGMGAYSPADVLKPGVMATIEADVLVPAVHTMKRARKPFKGLLYAGIMLTSGGPRVLEFNVRFGDPECQVILMRLESDLLDLIEAVIDERLDEVDVRWDSRPAITVVMAAEGYPGKYERGRAITGIEEADELPGVKVFHAGTQIKPGTENAADGPVVVSDGGRVLNVTAIGETIEQARQRAYTACEKIKFQGGWYRRDIAWQAMKESK